MSIHSSPALFQAKNLSLSPLWKSLFFGLDQGQALQIVGPNGSGKTSLIKVLCGLMYPDRGTLLWRRRDIHRHAEHYRREIAYVGHKDGIKGDLTPAENLFFLCAGHNIGAGRAPNGNGRLSIADALQYWGLADINLACRRLSAGQRRRAALARLLVLGGGLWFLDEPLTALDSDGKKILNGMITSHLQAGGMVVAATHQDLEWSFPAKSLMLGRQ